MVKGKPQGAACRLFPLTLERIGDPMLPMKDLRLSIGELIAADDAFLAPAANANKIALIKSAFSLEEGLEVGDLDLADFDGSAPIEGATGAQEAGLDPVTGDQIVTILDPAGGYRWEVSGDTNLPQTIYGFALLNNAGSGLIAAATLPAPITLTEEGQVINLGVVNLTIVARPVS